MVSVIIKPLQNTPLHIAAESGSVEIAKLLLDAGGDVNVKNNDGITPLFWVDDADHYGRYDIKELFEHRNEK